MSRPKDPAEVLREIIGTTDDIREFSDEVIDYIEAHAVRCETCLKWAMNDNMCWGDDEALYCECYDCKEGR